MTAGVQPLLTRSRIVIVISLAVLLASGYMITYSGRIQSGDSLRFFDAVSSWVDHGDLLLDESLWFRPPTRIFGSRDFPLSTLDLPESEPLHVLLGASVYSIASRIPFLGSVHMVWLVNIILTALTGGLLFLSCLSLRYNERTAVFAALIYGFTTVAWVYSKTFFREPVVAFFLVLSALAFIRWRQNNFGRHWRQILPGIVGLIALILAFLTKNSALFAILGLVIFVLPSWSYFTQSRYYDWINRALLLVVAILIPLIVFVTPVYDIFAQLLIASGLFTSADTVLIREAIHSYLFSIGGSIWGTSPTLLLAIPGTILLVIQRQYRLVWAVLAIVLGFSFGHAMFADIHWFGGQAWPPRFMVPTIPFVVLLTLPVLQNLLQAKRWRWVWIPAVLLVAYSVWIQFNGLSLDWSQYTKLLPEDTGGLSEWGGGLNQIEYLRWFVLPGLWGALGFDFAWVRSGQMVWIIPYALLAVASLVIVLRLVSNRLKRGILPFVMYGLPILWGVMTIFYLGQLHGVDGLYWAGKPALDEIRDVLKTNANGDDVLVLADPTYANYFLNQTDPNFPRTIILELQPGESVSESQPAEITSESVLDLITPETIRILDHLATKQGRIWFLASNSEFIPWAVRPVERYLIENYFLIQEYPTPTPDPTVRLLEFDTTHAPNESEFLNPEQLSGLTFGDAIQLAGFTLPNGRNYQPGESVPISFQWITDQSLEENVTISWFITNESGFFQDEADSQPMSGFAPSSEWTPGVPVWDHRALRLPADAPEGEYELWMRLYTRDQNGEIQHLPVTGGEARDGTIAILPITIFIQLQN